VEYRWNSRTPNLTVNHIVAEGVLDGLLTAGHRLLLERVPRLPDDPGPCDLLRVMPDPDDSGRLRAYAGLRCL
jgi:hypothetical protein